MTMGFSLPGRVTFALRIWSSEESFSSSDKLTVCLVGAQHDRGHHFPRRPRNFPAAPPVCRLAVCQGRRTTAILVSLSRCMNRTSVSDETTTAQPAHSGSLKTISAVFLGSRISRVRRKWAVSNFGSLSSHSRISASSTCFSRPSN
jgi:hypothetical protein